MADNNQQINEVIIDNVKYVPENKDKSGIKQDKNGNYKKNVFTGLNFFKYALKPKSKIIVVNMQLFTGDFMLFPIEVKNNIFIWKNKQYIVNEKYLHYNRTLQMYIGNYQENIALPLNFVVDSLEIKKELAKYKFEDLKTHELKSSDVIANIDPVILETFTKSTVIQKVFAGAQLEDAMRFIKMGVVIIGIIGILSLFILMKLAGWVKI